MYLTPSLAKKAAALLFMVDLLATAFPPAHIYFLQHNIYVTTTFAIVGLLAFLFLQNVNNSISDVDEIEGKLRSHAARGMRSRYRTSLKGVRSGIIHLSSRDDWHEIAMDVLPYTQTIHAVDVISPEQWDDPTTNKYRAAHQNGARAKHRIHVFMPDAHTKPDAYKKYIKNLTDVGVCLWFVEDHKFLSRERDTAELPFEKRGYILLNEGEAVGYARDPSRPTSDQRFGTFAFANTVDGKEEVEKFKQYFKMIMVHAHTTEEFDKLIGLKLPRDVLKKQRRLSQRRELKRALVQAVTWLG